MICDKRFDVYRQKTLPPTHALKMKSVDQLMEFKFPNGNAVVTNVSFFAGDWLVEIAVSEYNENVTLQKVAKRRGKIGDYLVGIETDSTTGYEYNIISKEEFIAKHVVPENEL